MKLPVTPQYNNEDIEKAWKSAENPEVIEAVFTHNKKYLHWEELKRRTLPIDPLYVWILMKLFRSRETKFLKFDDLELKYNLIDGFLEKLHKLDKSAAGAISSGLNSLPQDRDRFIINSLMEEAIASSQIEGAAVTRKIARQMLRESKKPENKDERMILNNYRTMQEIIRIKNDDLTPELIIKLHAMITENTLEDPEDEYRFRDNNEIEVVDGSGTTLHNPPDFNTIEESIRRLCIFANNDSDSFIHPVIKGIILHFLIGYIHPFNDGNGRTARSIFYWYMLRKDYWLFEYMAISRAIKDTRGKYKLVYLYTESDDNDLTYFIRYNLDVMEASVENLQKYIEKKQKETKMTIEILRDDEALTIRQAEILKEIMKHPEKLYTIKEIVGTYHVAYATARSDLFQLEKSGYLSRKKSGKSYLFFFEGVKNN